MSFRAQQCHSERSEESPLGLPPTPAGEHVVRLWRRESMELGLFLTFANGHQNEETGHRNARRFEHKGV